MFTFFTSFEVLFLHVKITGLFQHCVLTQMFIQDEFAGDGVDLYDDVIAAPPTTGGGGDENSQPPHTPGPPIQNSDGHSPNNANPPYHQMGNNIQPNQVGRRHQLYVGNLTWVSVTCRKY